MAASWDGSYRERRRAGSTDYDAFDIIRKSLLPALVLEIPNQGILAASPAARKLLGGSRGTSVEGRSLEDFTVDEPSGGLALIGAGRLQGYETARQLRRGNGSIPARLWVRSFDENIPPRYVLAVMSTGATETPAHVPMSAEGQLPSVIGTADENLLIDRISDDVAAFLGYTPEQLLGQSVLTLVAADDVPRWLAAIAQVTIARAGLMMRLQVHHANGLPLLYDAFIFAMLPTPSCVFVFLPSPQRSHTGRKTDAGEQLSRLRRGLNEVTLVSDPATTPTLPPVPGLGNLSAREIDIVGLLLAGDRVSGIATSLFLSQSTVRNHLAHVYRKLRVGSQQELISLLRQYDTDAAGKHS